MYYFYSHGIIVTLIFIAKYCLIQGLIDFFFDFFFICGNLFYEEFWLKLLFHKSYNLRLFKFYNL